MKQFKFHTPENTTGEAKTLLENINKNYGFIPNLFGYMAEAPYTIEAYTYLTTLLDKTDLTPAQQQVAMLAVSHYHDCEFCKVAHRAFAKINNANAETVEAIISNKVIKDSKDKALVDMVISIVENRGWVDEDSLSGFYAAGFSQRNVYDLILVTSIKTLSNYSNHLSQPEANEQFVAML